MNFNLVIDITVQASLFFHNFHPVKPEPACSLARLHMGYYNESLK